MDNVTPLIAKLDGLFAKKKSVEKLSQELFVEQVTPYNILEEYKSVDAEISDTKALLRNMFETAGIYETKVYKLGNANITVQHILGVDVGTLVNTTPVLSDPKFQKFITEKKTYGLSKTTDKDTFLDLLTANGYPAEAFRVHNYRVAVKEAKNGTKKRG